MTATTGDIVHIFSPEEGLREVRLDPTADAPSDNAYLDLLSSGGGVVSTSDVRELLCGFHPVAAWYDCTLVLLPCPCCRPESWSHEEAIAIKERLLDWMVERGQRDLRVVQDQEGDACDFIYVAFAPGTDSDDEEVTSCE